MKPKFIPWVAGGVAVLWSFIVPTWAVLALGLVVGVVLGQRLHPGRPWVPPPGQRGPLLRGLAGSGGRLLVLLVLVAPIASGGLFLPSRHNPNTFMKYLSVIAVIPSNLFSLPVLSFPGLPILVALALGILALGLYLPELILPRRIAALLQLGAIGASWWPLPSPTPLSEVVPRFILLGGSQRVWRRHNLVRLW